MKPLLIVKTGDTMPHLKKRRGDFEDWIEEGFEGLIEEIVIAAPHRGGRLPDPAAISGIVITGSHAMVTDHPAWSERTAHWIADVLAAEVPLLGVCYGHQLLAYALGGSVDVTAAGIEIGTVEVVLRPEATAGDLLLKDLPATIKAHASHTQSVTRLPPKAVRLASSESEPLHAFAVGDAAWGIQFHPEFDSEIMLAYVEEFAERIRESGQDPAVLKGNIRETPISRSILKRFAGILSEKGS
jgi:GMP synthase (glutamine-hydrolysing)